MKNDTFEEKTENPTEHRLKQEKEKGNNRYSRELYSLFILTTALINFWFNKDLIIQSLKKSFFHSFMFNNFVIENNFIENQLLLLKNGCIDLVRIIFVPILLIIIPSIILSCSSITIRFLKFDIRKLNPLSGLKKLFSSQSVISLVKTVLKIVLISFIVFLFISKYFLKSFNILDYTFNYMLHYNVEMAFLCFFVILVFFIPIVIIDFFWEKFRFYKKLRMTRKEISDELKNVEGNPFIKFRIRKMMQILSNNRMLSSVSQSDVIVVNPEHYAIAIQYNEKSMNSPKILAKGIGELAFKIKKIGNSHSIPILTSYPLARVLYYYTEVGGFIPSMLYSAVAEVLAWVWRIRDWKKKGGIFPKAPQKFFIPSEFCNSKKVKIE